MTSDALVDTTVLVYAYDSGEPVKQARAVELLDTLAQRGSGVLSTQILAEFFVIVTRKLAEPLSSADAYQRLENYLISWRVLGVTGAIVLEAARGVRDYQFHFWDAQHWALARFHQIPLILSEDFNPGAVIEGVRFMNPFDPNLAVAELVA